MAGFRYSDLAQADIDKIHEDIAPHNESAADKLVDQITEMCRELGKNPRMGADFSHIKTRAAGVSRQELRDPVSKAQESG